MKRTLLLCLFLLLIPLTANAQKTLQDAAATTATGSDLEINVGSQQTNGVTAQVSGTFSGTITWRATVDGTNYIDVMCTNLTTNTTATTATAAGLYSCLLPRVSKFRAPVTTYGSGSITVVAAAAVGVARLSTGGVTIGTTAITGGTSGRVLFDNAGVIGEDADLTFLADTLTVTKAVIGGGSAITSSGAGGALGSNAFTSTAYAPVASPTFTGTVTIPTPFTLGAVSVTATGTQLNYLNAATGTTGTTSTNLVYSTSPTLVTPTLGAALATSINGNTFTTGTYTLTGTAGKTLNFTNTLTLSGTDSTTQTFPTTSATIARTDAGQTFTGTQVIGGMSFAATNSITGGAGNMTITSGTGNSRTMILQTTTSGGVATTFLTGNADQSTTAAGPVFLPDGTAANPSTGFASNPTTGIYNTGGQFSISAVGTERLRVGASALQLSPGVISLGATLAAQDVFIARINPANIQLGAVTSATAAVAQTFGVSGSSGNSAAAALFTISGSDQSGTSTTGGGIKIRGGNGTTAGGTVEIWTSATTTPAVAVTVNADKTVQLASTTDSTTTTSGALQVAGGAAIRKRVFIDGITASSGLQTAVLCQSSGGEMIADSVACLASSGRFKWDIKPLVVGLDEVMRLRPVSYRYKPEGIFSHNANYLRERIGFIAEDINQVDSRLVGYEADGKTPRTIGYDQITPILVKSIQELKAEVDALKAEIQSLKQPRRIAFHLPSIIGL